MIALAGFLISSVLLFVGIFLIVREERRIDLTRQKERAANISQKQASRRSESYPVFAPGELSAWIQSGYIGKTMKERLALLETPADLPVVRPLITKHTIAYQDIAQAFGSAPPVEGARPRVSPFIREITQANVDPLREGRRRRSSAFSRGH